MRIGLISDIHGNLIALEVVLRELAREHVEQIVCLGDVGAIGPQPRQVIAHLRDLGCPVVLGNTDVWLLDPPSAPPNSPEEARIIREITRWCAEQLDAADRTYIGAFPPVLERALDDARTLLCFHGSPRSFDDVIAATTPDAEVEQMLAGYAATVMAGGHTHIQLLRRYEDSVILNVGSVGLPGVNAGSPALPMNHEVRWAEYGILTTMPGQMSIDLRRTALDVPAMLQEARRSGMPHLDWWAARWEASEPLVP